MSLLQKTSKVTMAVSSSTRKMVQHGDGLLKLFKFEKTISKATRWIRGVIGAKKEKQEIDNKSDHSEKTMRRSQHRHFPSRAHLRSSVSEPEIDQIKQAIKVATTSLATAEAAAQVAEAAIDTAARLSSSINGQPESGKSKHAIDVATASVAAVQSIVAAATATVVVARLTSYCNSGLSGDDDETEKSAAVMIQRVFRGYLARKALRALKGLVKLQALVRGNLVRNRVAATLHSMRGFAQTQQREICSIQNDRILERGMRPRESFENFDKTSSASRDLSFKSFEECPKMMEIDTCGFKFGVNTPVKPVKSSCGGCFFRPYYNKRPNYMANTHSFRAKLSSSRSIPKQKLEPPLPKKKISSNKIMAVRS